MEKHKSLHILHYSICPWGRRYKPGIQSFVIKFCRWPPSLKQSQPPHKGANSSAFMQRRALQSSSGVSMQMTSRDCATKAVHNTKFKCESRKGICLPTFRQRGLGQLNLFTSLSNRAGKLQEGHLQSEQQKEGDSEHWSLTAHSKTEFSAGQPHLSFTPHFSLKHRLRLSLLALTRKCRCHSESCLSANHSVNIPFWEPYTRHLSSNSMHKDYT